MKRFTSILFIMLFIAISVNGQDSLSISDIYEQNNNAVVYITQSLYFDPGDIYNTLLFERFEEAMEIELLDNYFPVSSGTGFFVTNDGYIITNAHVAKKVKVSELKEELLKGVSGWLRKVLPDKGFSRVEINDIADDFKSLFSRSKLQYRVKTSNDHDYSVEVVTSDADVDLALMKVDTEEPFNFAVLGDSRDLGVGDEVVAIGYPLQTSIDTFLTDFTSTLSSGIVSAIRTDNWGIQHTASINPGNSGGPLFNNSGLLVGINVGGMDGANDMYFSIPVLKLIRFLEDRKKEFILSANSSGSRINSSGAAIEQGPLKIGTTLYLRLDEEYDVYLNGELKGKTPLLLEDLKEKEYALLIESGEKFHKRQLLIDPEINDTVIYAPGLQYYTGKLLVESIPSGAEIYIDGDYKKETPFILSGLPVGNHKVVLKKAGFYLDAQEVSVTRDSIEKVKYRLIKTYPIHFEPVLFKGTRILLKNDSDEFKFKTSDKIALPAGEYSLSLTGDHYEEQKIEVTVEDKEVTVNTKKLFAKFPLGFMNLKAESRVFINDEDFTSFIIDDKCDVVAGEHKIRIETKDYLDYETKISITPQRERKVPVAYIPHPRLEAEANYMIGWSLIGGGALITAAGAVLNIDDAVLYFVDDYEGYVTMKNVGLGTIIGGGLVMAGGVTFNVLGLMKDEEAKKIDIDQNRPEKLSLNLSYNGRLSMDLNIKL